MADILIGGVEMEEAKLREWAKKLNVPIGYLRYMASADTFRPDSPEFAAAWAKIPKGKCFPKDLPGV